MKQLLLAALLIWSVQTKAQKKGVIVYDVTVEAQDTSYQSVMSAALLSKSLLNFSFKGKKKSRVQLRAGSFFNFVTAFNHRKGQYMRLLSNQDTKTAQFGDIETLAKSSLENPANYKLLEDTMTIVGFLCKKATIHTDFGELQCWYTNELDHDFTKVDFIDVDVPGLPLMFMTISGKVTMIFQAVRFEKLTREYKSFLKLKTPEGYTEIDTPDLGVQD